MSVQTASFPSRWQSGGKLMKNLLKSGLRSTENIHYQLEPQELVSDTLSLGQGILSNTGALVIKTGEFTGRSPKDRFIVRDSITENTVNWNEFNISLEPKYFETIYDAVALYLNERPHLWVRDCFACADDRYRLSIRVITEKPWSNLFAYNMFIRPKEELENFSPAWCVINVPDLKLDPRKCGIPHHNVTAVSFKHRLILIAGTGYTGEIKKGIFTILNYILPHEKKVLSMHCSANIGIDGDTAIFFGLSGTGKTTLSADPERKLIGDDEHGWPDNKIFNFEGGCYAKCINLTEQREPEIFNAIRAGALVENVCFFHGSNQINFSDPSVTENTRVSYPLHFISNAQDPAEGAVPKNIFFLTCDAFGVLPPISRLTPAQAMYQFISGYTAKVAGTETEVKEPKPTFSACFGAPFLPLHPGVYARMLGNKMQKHRVNVWLINTGWTGGCYGTGHRINLSHTRALIKATLENKFAGIDFETCKMFGFAIPKECPGVPWELLNPRNTWSDKNAYDEKATYLASLFIKNFEKYSSGVTGEILAAAPKQNL